MKTMRAALVTATLGTAMVACTSTTPQSAPTTTTTGGTSAVGTTAPSTTAAPTTAAPTTTAPPATPEALAAEAVDTTPLLDHGGLGAIRLGMTARELEATGLVVRESGDEPGASCSFYRFTSGTVGGVFAEREADRVASIIVEGDVRTPEGIRTGSTIEDARATYPGFADGHNWDSADLGNGAWYGFLGRPDVKGVLLFTKPRLCHD